MLFHSRAFRKAPSFKSLDLTLGIKTLAHSIAVVIGSVLLLCLSAAAAEQGAQTAKFKQGVGFAEVGLWQQAIACYKESLREGRPEVWGFEYCVESAARRDPFSSDAHLALGLAYLRKAETNPEDTETASYFSQAEYEFKQAMTVSQHGKNREAAALLTSLRMKCKPADYRLASAKLHHFSKYRFDCQLKVLKSRWSPQRNKRFLLSRVYVDKESSTGDLSAHLTMPSSNPEHDAIAVQTCQSMINDFPSMHWLGRRFQFVSEDGVNWIDEALHLGGATGYLAWAGFFDERSGCRAREDLASDYFNNRWTLKRVTSYCRPETKLPACMQDRHRLLWLSNAEVGVFDFPFSNAFGNVNWKFGFRRGEPRKACVYAQDGAWLLEYATPQFGKYSDDDLLIHLVSDAVFLALRKYELAHADTLDQKWSIRSKSPEPHERLIRNGDGKIVAFNSQLSDGRTLTVTLDEALEIQSILVDGKLDDCWNRAYLESDKSLELLDGTFKK
jgi:hypothetical protein